MKSTGGLQFLLSMVEICKSFPKWFDEDISSSKVSHNLFYVQKC